VAQEKKKRVRFLTGKRDSGKKLLCQRGGVPKIMGKAAGRRSKGATGLLILIYKETRERLEKKNLNETKRHRGRFAKKIFGGDDPERPAPEKYRFPEKGEIPEKPKEDKEGNTEGEKKEPKCRASLEPREKKGPSLGGEKKKIDKSKRGRGTEAIMDPLQREAARWDGRQYQKGERPFIASPIRAGGKTWILNSEGGESRRIMGTVATKGSMGKSVIGGRLLEVVVLQEGPCLVAKTGGKTKTVQGGGTSQEGAKAILAGGKSVAGTGGGETSIAEGRGRLMRKSIHFEGLVGKRRPTQCGWGNPVKTEAE